MKKPSRPKYNFDNVWAELAYEKPKARVGATALIGMESLKKFKLAKALKARAAKPTKRFKNRRG
jgi:hypothetical protein